MSDNHVTDLAKQASDAEAAAKVALAAAKAAKAALKAERPSQLTIIRRAVTENESVTVDALMTLLADRGHPEAKKSIVSGLRSDALSFLRLLRDMSRLVEDETEDEAETTDETEDQTATEDETETEVEQPRRRRARRAAA